MPSAPAAGCSSASYRPLPPPLPLPPSGKVDPSATACCQCSQVRRRQVRSWATDSRRRWIRAGGALTSRPPLPSTTAEPPARSVRTGPGEGQPPPPDPGERSPAEPPAVAVDCRLAACHPPSPLPPAAVTPTTAATRWLKRRKESRWRGEEVIERGAKRR